jgi:hypothetical protein
MPLASAIYGRIRASIRPTNAPGAAHAQCRRAPAPGRWSHWAIGRQAASALMRAGGDKPRRQRLVDDAVRRPKNAGPIVLVGRVADIKADTARPNWSSLGRCWPMPRCAPARCRAAAAGRPACNRNPGRFRFRIRATSPFEINQRAELEILLSVPAIGAVRHQRAKKTATGARTDSVALDQSDRQAGAGGFEASHNPATPAPTTSRSGDG